MMQIDCTIWRNFPSKIKIMKRGKGWARKKFHQSKVVIQIFSLPSKQGRCQTRKAVRGRSWVDFILLWTCLIKNLAAVFFTSVCLDKVYSTEPVYMFHLLCSSGRVRSTDHKCTVCDVDPNPDPHGFAFSENSKVRKFSQKMLIFTKKSS